MIKLSKISTLLAAFAVCGTCMAEPVFTLDNITTGTSEATLNVNMSNPDNEVIVVQCDIKLPDGITIGTNTYLEPIIDLSDRRVDHTVSSSWVPSTEVYRVVMYSGNNRPFRGNEGLLFSAPLEITCAPGSYTITLCNILVTFSDLNEVAAANATATITITEAEEVRYGDNQLYAKDITINEGENAELLVGYNSLSDLHEYSANIALPEGVTVESVEYYAVLTDKGYKNEWEFDNGVLSISGEQGGTAKKPKPSEAGDHLFARVSLNTATLTAGDYNIVISDQFISNEDDENDGNYEDIDAYTAKLTVKSTSVPQEQCETPEITINADGHIVATCATEGAKLHTTVTCADIDTFHHDSGEPVEMNGQYLITSYATANGKIDSEPAKAMLVWAKRDYSPTGVDVILASTERALLISTVGEYFVVRGTAKYEHIALYDLNGIMLYEGVAAEETTVIPVALNRNKVYVIVVADRSIKCTL